MSTAWNCDNADDRVDLEIQAPGFPEPQHPSEPDIFCRQVAMPAHDQEALEAAHVAVVGCGGIGSWVALGLARMGVRHLTLIDPDRFDRTNAPRQLMYWGDVGEFKAHALARNVVPHMTNPGVVRGIPDDARRVINHPLFRPDVVIVGVDTNAARLAVSDWARTGKRPAVFAMLSTDGLRAQAFLQRVEGPWLDQVLPDLDPTAAHPCAAACVASVFLVATHALALSLSATCGGTTPAWRETSLNGHVERVASLGRYSTAAIAAEIGY